MRHQSSGPLAFLRRLSGRNTPAFASRSQESKRQCRPGPDPRGREPGRPAAVSTQRCGGLDSDALPIWLLRAERVMGTK